MSCIHLTFDRLSKRYYSQVVLILCRLGNFLKKMTPYWSARCVMYFKSTYLVAYGFVYKFKKIWRPWRTRSRKQSGSKFSLVSFMYIGFWADFLPSSQPEECTILPKITWTNQVITIFNLNFLHIVQPKFTKIE